MSLPCLSSATILRCEGLNRVEYGVLFIPVGLQFVFLMWALINTRSFKSDLMALAFADATSILVLSIIDLLSHELPAARWSLRVFQAFDIVIGTLSFLPLVIIAAFLYLLCRTYCFPSLPRKMIRVLKYVFLVLIPLTILTNELGSFIGINYRIIEDIKTQALAIGFKDPGKETLWHVFTGLTLVLFMAYQSAIFSLSLHFILHREQKLQPDPNNVRSVLGIPVPILLSIGAAIGSVESILGFVEGGFAIAFTRRLLRLLSRFCLVLCAMKSSERWRNPISKLPSLVFSPRDGAFTQLNGEVLPNVSGINSDTDEKGRARRVTLRYNGKQPPTLNVRLSVLSLPSPEGLSESIKRRHTLEEAHHHASMRSVNPLISAPVSQLPASYWPPGNSAVDKGRGRSHSDDSVVLGRVNFSRDNQYLANSRILSASSLASDSLSIVRDLESRFPGIPPRVTRVGDVSQAAPYTPSESSGQSFLELSGRLSSDRLNVDSPGLQRSLTERSDSVLSPFDNPRSLKKRPVVKPPPITISKARSSISRRVLIDREPPSASPRRMTIASTMSGQSIGNPFVYDDFEYRESEVYRSDAGLGRIATKVIELEGRREEARRKAISLIAQDLDKSANVGKLTSFLRPTPSPASSRNVTPQITPLGSPWVENQDSPALIQSIRREDRSGTLLLSDNSRIKSFGQVSMRQTPIPSLHSSQRTSMRIEQLVAQSKTL